MIWVLVLYVNLDCWFEIEGKYVVSFTKWSMVDFSKSFVSMDNAVAANGDGLEDVEITSIAVSLIEILKKIQEIETTIVSNVNHFIASVLVQPTNVAKCDMFTYIVSMVIYLWQYQQFNLDSILRGLHKQSITSLHAYFCPDVKSSESDPKSQTNLIDPYKEVTAQLQQLSTMKPRKCSSCHKESVFAFINAQLRSADEGMTTFVMCGHCGVRHRM